MRWALDLDGLGDAEAVVVAASTEHHWDLDRHRQAGLPVLVEKPMCPSAVEANALLDLARDAGVPIMCGLVERFNPAVVAAMTMLKGRASFGASGTHHMPPGSGPAWRGTCSCTIWTWRCGSSVRGGQSRSPGRSATSILPRSGAEDVVEASLRFDAGEMVSLSASRIGQRKVRTMVIQELGRMIEVDLLRRSVTAYRHTTIEGATAHGGFRQYTEIEVPEIIGTEPLVAQLDHFATLVQGDVDADAERESVRPAHDIIDAVLRGTVPRGEKRRSVTRRSDVADHPGWHAGNDSVCWHTPSDHGSGSDERTARWSRPC